MLFVGQVCITNLVFQVSALQTLFHGFPIFATLCFLSEDDDTSKVTADELSVFYKEFLDSKFKDQLNFTRLHNSNTVKYNNTYHMEWF